MSAAPYRPFPNQFRADLRAGKRLIGCWASLAAPITAEILGLAGFDWILLDGEHSPNDVTTLVPQLMALKGSPSAPVVRPPCNEPIIIKRLLDIGFHNFLLPNVETADQARSAVAATRYPPKGIRGVSVAHRSNMYGTVPGYFRDIDDNITVVVQIESRAGFAAVDEIAAVEGVDGLFVGPSGKAAGILAGVEADARRYLDWGATFVAVGSDLGLFRAASQALSDRFREPAPTALRAGLK